MAKKKSGRKWIAGVLAAALVAGAGGAVYLKTQKAAQAADEEGVKSTVQTVTAEIGIRKAIGAGEGSILFQFLVEALMLSLMGDLLGVVMSWTILQVVARITGFSAAMDKGVVIVATVFSLLIGLIFGLYPARKAAKKKPIDALHAQ